MACWPLVPTQSSQRVTLILQFLLLRLIGCHWATQFLKRHPGYSVRKQKTLEIQKKHAHNPTHIAEWFQTFRNTLAKHGIQPQDIYNMGETGSRIGIGKDQKIITIDSGRQSYLASSSNRELVTVIECVAANGSVLAPMVILPGKVHQDN